MSRALTREQRICLAETMLKTVQAMPSLMQRSFVHRHYEDLSTFEISRRLGLAEEDIVLLLRSARRRFDECMRHSVPERQAPAACACCG